VNNNQLDLLASPELERLKLPDAEIYLQRSLVLEPPADQLLNLLIEATPWQQEKITVYGKQHLQPRLSAWYGSAGSDYGYSGIRLRAMPWTQVLLEIKARVEGVAETEFNSVLINYYRDHNDSMGMHSDDEPELGRQPVIASLSLGEQRTLVLRHKFRKDLASIKLVLNPGSLLIMKGITQACWKHGISKQRISCGPRVNLTFRDVEIR
jgi:alkylated DNA repair dioxygenase AlkB